jgi:hypothetical protein
MRVGVLSAHLKVTPNRAFLKAVLETSHSSVLNCFGQNWKCDVTRRDARVS